MAASALIDLLWLTSRWFILVAAVWQASQSHFEAGPSESFFPLLRTNLLYVAALAGTGLAVAALFSLLQSNLRLYGTLLGTFGITLLVLLRQYFVLLDNRRLRQALQQLAVTDALTGLANRRRFDETLAREISRAERYQRPLAVLLIDVNNFKHYNDRYGHLEGDRILRGVADLLQANLRSSDLAARYGGDEFVVVLLEADAGVAEQVAGKLGEAALALGAGVSLSIGRATLQPGLAAAALLEAADQDMYQRKPQDARSRAPLKA